MAVVTGSLRDFGLSAVPDLTPVIDFTPSSGGVGAGVVLIDRPVSVTPNTSGSFSVTLQPLDMVRPAAFYTITVRWLNGDGIPVGFTEIPGRLWVVEPGGTVSDLLRTGSGAPGMVWVGLVPPPERGPFTYWYVSNPLGADLPGIPPRGYDIGDLIDWTN